MRTRLPCDWYPVGLHHLEAVTALTTLTEEVVVVVEEVLGLDRVVARQCALNRASDPRGS